MSTELSRFLLEENTPDQIAAVDTITLVPSAIVSVSTSSICITHTTSGCDNNDAPNPIFTAIDPTLEMEPDGENEDSEDDDEEHEDS